MLKHQTKTKHFAYHSFEKVIEWIFLRSLLFEFSQVHLFVFTRKYFLFLTNGKDWFFSGYKFVLFLESLDDVISLKLALKTKSGDVFCMA